MIHRKVSAQSMAHDDPPANSVEADDVQRNVDDLLSDADRAKRRASSEESSDNGAAREAMNGRSPESADGAAEDEPSATHELDGPVEDLISDAVSAVDALEDSLGPGAAPTEEDEAAVAECADEANQLVEEAAEAMRAPGASEKVAVVEFDDDFEDDETPVDAATAPKQTPKPVADDSPQTIEALDARIEAEAAAFEEELDELEGEFHSADEIETLDDAAPPSARSEDDGPAIEIDDSVAEISLDDEEEADAAPARERAAVDSPFADDAAPPAPRPARNTTPSPAPSSSAKPRSASETKPASKRSKREAMMSIAPLAHRFVLKPLARPLAKLDPTVRDTIGWVGLNTLFIALCLWIFLMIR